MKIDLTSSSKESRGTHFESLPINPHPLEHALSPKFLFPVGSFTPEKQAVAAPDSLNKQNETSLPVAISELAKLISELDYRLVELFDRLSASRNHTSLFNPDISLAITQVNNLATQSIWDILRTYGKLFEEKIKQRYPSINTNQNPKFRYSLERHAQNTLVYSRLLAGQEPNTQCIIYLSPDMNYVTFSTNSRENKLFLRQDINSQSLTSLRPFVS